MSELSKKCVLLKELPFDIGQEEVHNILQTAGYWAWVDKIYPYMEKEDDKRWIVLFKSEEGQ